MWVCRRRSAHLAAAGQPCGQTFANFFAHFFVLKSAVQHSSDALQSLQPARRRLLGSGGRTAIAARQQCTLARYSAH
jgi:hypothetical protein